METQLIPDAQDAPTTQRVAVRPVLAFSRPVKPTPKKSPRKLSMRRPKPERYTVEEAFDYFYGPTSSDEHDALNEQRVIRAVAFLLTYCSQHGNESVDGNLANGLARILELHAKRSE